MINANLSGTKTAEKGVLNLLGQFIPGVIGYVKILADDCRQNLRIVIGVTKEAKAFRDRQFGSAMSAAASIITGS